MYLVHPINLSNMEILFRRDEMKLQVEVRGKKPYRETKILVNIQRTGL